MGPTVSSRELGRAPVKEAIKILVMLAPRGIMTLSLTDKNSSPLQDFARSKISDKNVNMELEASLQTNENKKNKNEKTENLNKMYHINSLLCL